MTTDGTDFDLAATFFGPPATPEASAEQVLAFEEVVDVAETLVLSRDRANWITIDLSLGTYAAICFLPAAGTGEPHVVMGMVEVFTVSP